MDANNPKFKEFLNLKDQMDANEKYINDQTKSAEEKIKEFDEQFQEQVVDTNLPHLSNLNEDPQLNGKVLFPLLKENTLIGKKKSDSSPDIILNVLGVKPNHCTIMNHLGKLFISRED